jgi:cytochrome P450
VAHARRLSASSENGTEETPGLFGAVVRAAGSPAPVPLDSDRFLLVTEPAAARDVLARPDDFTFPFDITRRPIRGSSDGSPRKELAPLSAAAVARGRSVFSRELDRIPVTDEWVELDAMVALRRPVSIAAVAALRPQAPEADRVALADRAAAWIDALAPIISADRSPRPWSRVRRHERRARRELTGALSDAGSGEPAKDATAMGAAVQVPIAAGAITLALLAAAPGAQQRVADPEYATAFAWEVLRLYPATWLMPRITTRDVVVGQTPVPAYTPVVVSPVALGRLEELVPGPGTGHAPLDRLDAERWLASGSRPGAWLPFGAGLHACPGRNLGMAQLVDLLTWAGRHDWEPTAPFRVYDRRGLVADPSVVRIRRKRVA